jgi:hypothetical protein
MLIASFIQTPLYVKKPESNTIAMVFNPAINIFAGRK